MIGLLYCLINPGMTYATSTEFFKFGTRIYFPAPTCSVVLDPICSICQETQYAARISRNGNSKAYDMYVIKSCSHMFCIGCLDLWLKEQNTCPMCRRVLFTQWKDSMKEMDDWIGLMEYLDIVDIGGPAATRMRTGYEYDTGQSWEMIFEIKRILHGG